MTALDYARTLTLEAARLVYAEILGRPATPARSSALRALRRAHPELKPSAVGLTPDEALTRLRASGHLWSTP